MTDAVARLVALTDAVGDGWDGGEGHQQERCGQGGESGSAEDDRAVIMNAHPLDFIRCNYGSPVRITTESSPRHCGVRMPETRPKST